MAVAAAVHPRLVLPWYQPQTLHQNHTPNDPPGYHSKDPQKPVILHPPLILPLKPRPINQPTVLMPPLLPVHLPPHVRGELDPDVQPERVVVERLALPAALAELPCVALLVVVLVMEHGVRGAEDAAPALEVVVAVVTRVGAV